MRGRLDPGAPWRDGCQRRSQGGIREAARWMFTDDLGNNAWSKCSEVFSKAGKIMRWTRTREGIRKDAEQRPLTISGRAP